MTTYITVDPGKKGGLVVLRDGDIIDCRKMINDYMALHAFIKEIAIIANRNPLYAIVEQVHSMPKQGVVSAFTFGQGYGALLMAFASLDIPVYFVTPQRWMKDLGLKRSKETSKLTWKKALQEYAKAVWPETDPTLETADALLIALWVLQKEKKGESPWLHQSS